MYHYVPNWLLSRPYDLILSLCTKLIPFKTISPPFLKWSWKESTGYTMIKSGQMVLKGVSWMDKTKISSYGLERRLPKKVTPTFFYIVYPFDSFKTIWPDICIVYSIDSFQDHLIQFYHDVPNWLFSISYDKIFVLYCVPSWLLSRPFDPIYNM